MAGLQQTDPAPPQAPTNETEAQIIEILGRLGVTEKQWYQSKSMVFALLTVVLGVALFFGFVPGDMAMSEQIVGTIVAVIGGIFAVLRMVTKTPVG